MTVYTRATRDGIRGPGVVSNGHVVQWVSLTGGWYSRTYPRPVPEGVRLIVFLESHLDADGYRDLLAGKYDLHLARLAETLPPDAIIRFDHEMDAPPNHWRTWGGMDPALYVAVWKYVSFKLMRAMFWCPSGHRVDPAYYPDGYGYVSHVGFTRYDLGFRDKRGRRITAARQWRAPLRKLRALAPGVPIIVGETGSLDDDTGDRLPWLRSAKRVRGLEMVVLFDLDMSAAEGRSWLVPGYMVEVWER